MGLVVAGTLSDYRDAERAPTDIAAGLHVLPWEAEAMNRVWGKPDLAALRDRLIAVVTSLRSDINTGNTLMFTDFGGQLVSLATIGCLAFFFI